MKLIEVWHREMAGMKLVAVVNVSDVHPDLQDWELLEFAWRWTNNVEGSWSRPEFLPSGPGALAAGRNQFLGLPSSKNGDFNEHVHVVGELPGIRSSSVGDIFVLIEDGQPEQPYEVAGCGFRKLEEVAVA